MQVYGGVKYNILLKIPNTCYFGELVITNTIITKVYINLKSIHHNNIYYCVKNPNYVFNTLDLTLLNLITY